MSWTIAQLSQVASIERNGISPNEIVSGSLYVGLEHISSDGTFSNVQPVENGELASTKYTFTSKHLLYGKLRPNLAKVARPTFNGVCSTDILPVMPGPNIDRGFLHHFLRQPKIVDFAASRAVGVNLPRLSPSILAKFEIPLPPLAEQKRISTILDCAEALRAKRRTAIAMLDQLAHSLFIDMFGDPFSNPCGFPPKTLGEIISFKGGSQPPKDVFSYKPAEDVVRLVQIRDFKSDQFKTFIPKILARRFFDVDDVMIARYGPPVFQILRGLSGSYNVALIKAEPGNDVSKDFIFYLLQEPRLQKYVIAHSERTAGQSGVNLDLLEKYPAYLPPRSLQEIFSLRLATIQSLSALQRESLKHAEAMFESLQCRAFKGEL